MYPIYMWVTSHFPKIGKLTISKQSHKKKQANIRIKGKIKISSLLIHKLSIATFITYEVWTGMKLVGLL